MTPNIYYKKVGKKYIPIEYWEIQGYPPGLYLIYNTDHCKTMMNATAYAQIHEIKNLGKWSDLVVNFKQELIKNVLDKYKDSEYSLDSIVNEIFKQIADERSNH